MNPGECFDALSETRGALKYILILSDPGNERLERLQLIEKMRDGGINRDRFYKITAALNQIGIVTVEPTQPNGRIKKVHTALTQKGRKTAERLSQIKAILEE